MIAGYPQEAKGKVKFRNYLVVNQTIANEEQGSDEGTPDCVLHDFIFNTTVCTPLMVLNTTISTPLMVPAVKSGYACYKLV